MRAGLPRVRTTAQALALCETHPSLGRLRREHGEKVEVVIQLYLVELGELVNIKRPLTEKQIALIAQEVVSRYPFFTMVDLHVLFRRAVTGGFGEWYESLDVPKVMRWFSLYFQERCSLAEEESINHRHYDKGDNLTPERMTQYFDRITRKIQ